MRNHDWIDGVNYVLTYDQLHDSLELGKFPDLKCMMDMTNERLDGIILVPRLPSFFREKS